MQQYTIQLWHSALRISSFSKAGPSVPSAGQPWPLMFIPFLQVYGLLDNLVTDMMILADELSPLKNVEEPLRFCS